MQKTYNFGTHWVTTSEELTGFLECFYVTDEQVALIENGANLELEEGNLIIEEATQITSE